MHKDEPRERLVQLIVEAGEQTRAQADSMQEATAEFPLLVAEGEGIWASVSDEASDAEERGAILSEFRQGVRRTLDDLLDLLETKDVGALPDELHYLLGQCRAVGAQRMQLTVGACKSAFDHQKLVQLEALLGETLAAMDARCGTPHESTGAQQLHAKQLVERFPAAPEPRMSPEVPRYLTTKLSDLSLRPDDKLQSQSALDEGLPLVNWDKARALGHQLESACAECEKLLEELHTSLISCSEHNQLLLHSLGGNYELMGAIRIARLVIDCECHAAEFGPSQLEALKTLHTATLTALSAPDAPLADGASLAPSLSGPPIGGHAGRAATSAAPPVRGKLFVATMDTTSFTRKLNESLLFPALGADMERSATIGVTESEQVGFIDFALGRVDAALQPLPQVHRQADVVILDDSIALSNAPHFSFSGAGVVLRLRELGFAGTTCILTAQGDERMAELTAMPGVDIAEPKTFNPAMLAMKLLQAHKLKAATTGSPGDAAMLPASLINLSHFAGLPHPIICSLVQEAFDKTMEPADPMTPSAAARYSSDLSLYTRMSELQALVASGEDVAHICHTLEGVAKTAGACQLANEVQAFSQAPNVEGTSLLWSLLEATRSEVQAQGYFV